MTTSTNGSTPSPVPETAKREGDVRARWAWTEPSVWTERMLVALEKGVQGGKWYSLIDKVCAEANLLSAWKRVENNAGAAGADRQTVEQFATQAESSLKWLEQQLRSGQYVPSPIRRHYIPKPGSPKLRPLGIPAVRDRIVQTAVRNVLEPIFESGFESASYGFRPGRGAQGALRLVDELLEAGKTWVVDVDIESFFDTIEVPRLMALVGEKMTDGRVLKLIEQFARNRVMDEMREWTPVSGVPQGAPISPMLANIYLHPIDVALRQAGLQHVRYADDLVILCDTEDEARRALELLSEQMKQRGLNLSQEKTKVVDATAPGGFDFLGYHFEQGKKTPRKKSLEKLKDNVRAKTPRKSGTSLERTIKRLNPTLRGWWGYFRHCERWVHEKLDGWIRRRLRAMLQRFAKKRGTGAGFANARWPNAFFADAGLFSLTAAWTGANRSR